MPRVKLNEKQKNEIVHLYRTTDASTRELGERFEVNQAPYLGS